MTAELRSVVTGLLSLACVEEQALLAAGASGPGHDPAGPGDRGGSPETWAAAPLVAHNNEFKSQQAERIVAIRSGRVPPAFGEVDHGSAELYQRYSAQSADEVMVGCRRVTAELIEGTWALPDEDLLDPARHPWLNGRLLWLQIIVRGFWHPTGHLGGYYLGHGQPERAVALQEHALATARYLGAPPAAVGMAGYSLACAQARSGPPDEAARTLAEAIRANPDLRAHASRDPDLAALREVLRVRTGRGPPLKLRLPRYGTSRAGRPLKLSVMSQPVSFYEAVGGEETFRRLVHRFYQGVADDPVLRPVYPTRDLGPAEEHLRLFLMQYWGGPRTYDELRGHPRLRMRHARFTIGEAERDAWLRNMRVALDELALDEALDAQLWEYLVMAAHSLVNVEPTDGRRDLGLTPKTPA